ncbi:DUF992 domain-containing protein [Bosea sp. PAMC 26642]|uniref:DUF992 domain-containing protein n=1 Tax=Bosea sp. (strain PAMC 26642) TaxID=1792307 RepID=UPI000770122E|nr:DUF992 domain-containing protein [Bosea sp. PAMC 26642]AMJ59661.1 hypothetical protein AXW83_04490 [Bosea sp. PAMC 26642]
MMKTTTKLFLSLAVSLALFPIAASAKPTVRAGELICNVAGGTGMILTSEKALTCRYDAVGGRVEFYTGTIKKFGLDIGKTTEGGMVWAVVEPALRPGGLNGTYNGVTAEITVGVGAGASVLVGGNDGAVTLQPLSFQGQTGANLAVGVGSLTLTEISAPPARRSHNRRHSQHGRMHNG